MILNREFQGYCIYCQEPKWACLRCYWLNRLKCCETEEELKKALSRFSIDPFVPEPNPPDSDPLPF